MRHIPFVDYNSKQLITITPPYNTSGQRWRLLRKRYSVRVEFQQTGSLGTEYTTTTTASSSSFLLPLKIVHCNKHVLSLSLLFSRNDFIPQFTSQVSVRSWSPHTHCYYYRHNSFICTTKQDGVQAKCL